MGIYSVIFSELVLNIKKHKKVLTKWCDYGIISTVNAMMELCERSKPLQRADGCCESVGKPCCNLAPEQGS